MSQPAWPVSRRPGARAAELGGIDGAVSALTRFLVPGARVFVPTLSGESALWAEALAADTERAAGVTFCGVQFPGIDRMDYPALHPQARVEAHFMSPALRAGQAAGRIDLLALDYLGIARHFMRASPRTWRWPSSRPPMPTAGAAPAWLATFCRWFGSGPAAGWRI